MYKGKITVKSAYWTHENPVVVEYPPAYAGAKPLRTSLNTFEVIHTIEGDCVVEIDALAAEVAKRALHSKNGTASGMHGKIKVRRLGAVREIETERKPMKLPKSARIVEEQQP